jgi:hypothetical protein
MDKTWPTLDKFNIFTFIIEKMDILYAYIKFGKKIISLNMKKRGKSKTCYRKSEEKGEFESLGMSP